MSYDNIVHYSIKMSGVIITSREQFKARGRSEVFRDEMMIEYIFYA